MVQRLSFCLVALFDQDFDYDEFQAALDEGRSNAKFNLPGAMVPIGTSYHFNRLPFS